MHAGPNNQKRDLRYLIALAKELDAGIIPVGLYKHFLDRLGGNRSTEEVLRKSRQRQRQMEAGGNVEAAVALMSSKDEDDQAPDKRVKCLLGAAAHHSVPCSPPLVVGSFATRAGKGGHVTKSRDDVQTAVEGVKYCLGSKLSQYMPPDLLFDW